jgi:hypothetical protein
LDIDRGFAFTVAPGTLAQMCAEKFEDWIGEVREVST